MSKFTDDIGHSISGFYDALAVDYDLMTGFTKRFVLEKPFFHMLMDKYKIHTAFDAGCGTGFHSLLLAQMGVNVSAVDASPEMVRRLQLHAEEMKLVLKTFVARFEDLPQVVHEKFDLVLCMGNSLAHILIEQDMLAVLKNFRGLLECDGVLFFQILNYDRILSRRERIQSKKETAAKTFVRSYEYDEQRILFNVQTTEKSNEGTKEKQQTIPLRPWLREELAELLQRAGFTTVHSYGSIALQDFQPEESKDLVILARGEL